MKNEIRLRASGASVPVCRRTLDRSGELGRKETQLDLFTASGFRGVSPLRVLMVLWRRSHDREELARSLRRELDPGYR